jgi:hypothetical protein
MKQKEIILRALQENEGKWFLPQDFMQMNRPDLFVGYEASARLSELARDYPNNIKTTRNGRQMMRCWVSDGAML